VYLCGPSNDFIIRATLKILMMMMMMMMMMIHAGEKVPYRNYFITGVSQSCILMTNAACCSGKVGD